MKSYTDKANEVYTFLEIHGKEQPKLIKGFTDMHQAGIQSGFLDAKQKELIALGISITIRCEGCIACHVESALKAGASQDEIVETIGVAIVMGGGPSVVYGNKAYQAMKEMM
ncbi:MAG: carboxymuconolactone decarboxylase family protein [Mangrovibacterium sp.]